MDTTSWIDSLANFQILGNSALRWGLAAVFVFCSYLIFKGLIRVLQLRFRNAEGNTFRLIMGDILRETHRVFLFFCSLQVGFLVLTVPDQTHKTFSRVLAILTLIQVAIWGSHAIELAIKTALQKRASVDPASVSTLGLIGTGLKFSLFATLVLMGLNFLGVNITALVAGLGVGGIAVALAAQNLLGDLFASLTIVLDKPFIVGETVAVGDFTGTVERIGLKNTRLRSQNGEMLVFANNDLLQSRLRNLKRVTERRMTQKLNIAYGTSVVRMRLIADWARTCVESQPNVRFDSCLLTQLSDSAQVFELIYWFTQPEGLLGPPTHQAILMALLEKFEQEGIALAYPTQTINVVKAATS